MTNSPIDGQLKRVLVAPSWRRESDPQGRVESTIRSEISETLPDVSVILGEGDPAEVILQPPRLALRISS